MVRIDMAELAGSEVLAGAVSGRSGLSKLVAQALPPVTPMPVYLDFGNVQVATASYLRESVIAFRDLVRRQRTTAYPVIANANELVRDELDELMRSRGDALPACQIDQAGDILSTELIGELDPKQRITFDLVSSCGETDAGELMREHGASEGLSRVTAWNNRLASLAAIGLIMEIPQGRSKRYRPVFEEA